MSKISKKLLREIYDLHSIIGSIKNAYYDDRGNRAEKIISLCDEGLEKGQRIIDSQDPLL